MHGPTAGIDWLMANADAWIDTWLHGSTNTWRCKEAWMHGPKGGIDWLVANADVWIDTWMDASTGAWRRMDRKLE